MIPKDEEPIEIQRPFIKKISTAVVELLSSRVADFCELLCRENPQSEIAPMVFVNPQKEKRWYSEEDLQTHRSRCHGYEDLHWLLREFWPCRCGADHENKLGSRMNIMLCLRSGWTRPKLALKEYDMILQHELASLHCSILIQTDK